LDRLFAIFIYNHSGTLLPAVLTATSHSYGNSISHKPPNLLTVYDKTGHNWLRSRDEHVTQYLCQGSVWANTWNIRPCLFLFWFIFSRTRLLKWPVGGFSCTMAQITRNHARKCLFGVYIISENPY